MAERADRIQVECMRDKSLNAAWTRVEVAMRQLVRAHLQQSCQSRPCNDLMTIFMSLNNPRDLLIPVRQDAWVPQGKRKTPGQGCQAKALHNARAHASLRFTACSAVAEQEVPT
jgi:hypothetical protein